MKNLTAFAPKKEYLDCVAIANRLRVELKKAFPSVKFSITSKRYAGGSSVTIKYNDGPLTKHVERFAARYKFVHFDGMDDSTSYSENLVMRDGELIEESGGSYIFASRTWTDATRDAILDELAKRYGVDVRDGFGRYVTQDGSNRWEPYGEREDIYTIAHQKFHRTDFLASKEACYSHYELDCADCAENPGR